MSSSRAEGRTSARKPRTTKTEPTMVSGPMVSVHGAFKKLVTDVVTFLKNHDDYKEIPCKELKVKTLMTDMGWDGIIKIETTKDEVDVDHKKEMAALKKKFPKPGFMPKNKDLCFALTKNRSCYSQCNATKKRGLDFCNKCLIAKEKNGGVLKYGHIDNRAVMTKIVKDIGVDEDGEAVTETVEVEDYMAFVAPDGKKPEPYANLIKDFDLTIEEEREEVEDKIEEVWGVRVSIPENQWKKTKATKSSKSSTSSTKSGASKVPADPVEKMCAEEYKKAVKEHYDSLCTNTHTTLDGVWTQEKTENKRKYEDRVAQAKVTMDLALNDDVRVKKAELKEQAAEKVKEINESFDQQIAEDGADSDKLKEERKAAIVAAKKPFTWTANKKEFIDKHHATVAFKQFKKEEKAYLKMQNDASKERRDAGKKNFNELKKELIAKMMKKYERGMVFDAENALPFGTEPEVTVTFEKFSPKTPEGSDGAMSPIAGDGDEEGFTEDEEEFDAEEDVDETE